MEFPDSVRKHHDYQDCHCFLDFAVNQARVEAQHTQHCCHMCEGIL